MSADKNMMDKLLIPVATLVVNAAMTYGVISTQLQWIRADLDRQQRHIEQIQATLQHKGIGP